MRVQITGERSLIEVASAQLRDEQGASVVEVRDARDDTELAFGVVEVGAVVGIVAGIAQLIDLLLRLKDRLGSADEPKTTPLKIATAKGLITLELNQQITAEELRSLLEPIS